MKNLKDEIKFPCGLTMKNRFMLAPLTNTQSNENGTLSDDEFNWLTMRARGNFGLTMSCASHVQAIGKGFPGQLGIFGDEHLEGLKRLTDAIKSHESLAVAQLHHAGMRSPENIIGLQPVCPSDDKETNSRALSLDEVKRLRDDFIEAGVRAKNGGYNGVEIHGAHGYILCQFLSADINKRDDEYGGSLENRSRIIFEIIDGIRDKCGSEFLLGVRLSAERFGIKLGETKEVCKKLIDSNKIDFLDMSLWDSFKEPIEEEYKGKSLLEHFSELDMKDIKLTVAGNIRTGKNVFKVLNNKVDFVTIGRAAILHHDFPDRVMRNPNFEPIELPASRSHLIKEGLSEKFIQYMGAWPGFAEKV
ncbi:NADH:flavin oxidoreductase [Gammaproteobacteria bacterium]|nr:NADH:flavin oxidoreductase [Gammaproteobacteria bacterium]